MCFVIPLFIFFILRAYNLSLSYIFITISYASIILINSINASFDILYDCLWHTILFSMQLLKNDKDNASLCSLWHILPSYIVGKGGILATILATVVAIGMDLLSYTIQC